MIYTLSELNLFFFPLLEIGNVAKAKICLNLVKNFCGDGVMYRDIENQVNQIKSNASSVKIKGKFAFIELDFIFSHISRSHNSTLTLYVVPNLSDGEHDTLPHATRKIEIRTTPECGNFVVANQAMKAGETIVVEKPIATCLLPKYFGSHCLHCLRR